MNFEKRKTVIFMIFFTPCWVSGTKGYLAKTLFEATKWIVETVRRRNRDGVAKEKQTNDVEGRMIKHIKAKPRKTQFVLPTDAYSIDIRRQTLRL